MAANDTFSSVLGWISIASWIVVYSPQMIENYRLKSGEALSLLFVAIWLLGDLCNLVGATMAGLLPTVIILAVYYSLCDIILIFQIYYYRWTNPARPSIQVPPETPSDTEASEQSPLLAADSSQSRHAEKETSVKRAFLEYTAAIMFVFATGVVAWAISEKVNQGEDETRPDEIFEWKSQVIGWISAVLYLGARIPQIFKNLRTKCEGLSPGLFLFSIFGNLTYALSICVSSMELDHLIANASWLAGSLLTIFLDAFVLGQFFYYRTEARMYRTSTIA